MFLIGSVSKVLGPALRLGWVVCPPEHRDAVAHAKRLADHGTPALDQLALARLIESGRYDRHLRRMRALCARKREALIAALAEHAPAVELSGLAAGFHAVARLPAGADESAVAQAARERGVGVYPMARYRLEAADHPPQLVLGFGNLSESAIGRGVATIGDLLDRPGAALAAATAAAIDRIEKPAKLAVNTELRRLFRTACPGVGASWRHCRRWPGGEIDRSALGPALGAVVEPGPDLQRLCLDFPDDESMRVSHGAIYQSL